MDTVAAVEQCARRMNEIDANDLHGRVCGVLRRAKLPRNNLTMDQRKALKELSNMEDVVVLPADKGNTTVLMTAVDYDSKLSGMLSTGTYRVVRKNPTKASEDRLVRKLRALYKKGNLPNSLYWRIRPAGSTPPMIYSLQKIHKEHVPLRPIVSCIGSPSYPLSKH